MSTNAGSADADRSEPAQVQPAQVLRGHVERFQEGHLVGWMVDPREPWIRQQVGVFLGDELVASTVADAFRADLRDAGLSDGRSGFAVPLSRRDIRSILDRGGRVRVAPLRDRGATMGEHAFSAADLPSRITASIDGWDGTTLTGWAADLEEPGVPALLRVASGGETVATILAATWRGDVKEAGIGTGWHGFEIALDAKVVEDAQAAGGELALTPHGSPGQVLATFSVLPSFLRPEDSRWPRLRAALADAVQLLLRRLDELGAAPAEGAPPGRPIYERLLDPVVIPAEDGQPAEPGRAAPALSGYLDFTRLRMRQDENFDTDADPGQAVRFLDWYLRRYSTTRGRLRAPLSRREIDLLNEPALLGHRFALTRASLAHLLDHQALREDMDLNNADWFASAVYWWCAYGAPGLFVEDCLVPEPYVRVLRTVHARWNRIAHPLSVFMERHLEDSEQLHFLDMDSVEDRGTYTLALLVLGVGRPDLLRFLPGHSIDRALASRDGTSPLEAFLRHLAPRPEPVRLPRATYEALLRRAGYDLGSHTFRTLTPAGHRVGAAALPRVADGTPVDVQLIGPFGKASGLGQATRLSAAALEHTGLTRNFVDFGMDNPAPEGFSSASASAGFRKARINLVHLNAESVPLALAYGPDVFSGAYNIGYFFWELDSPASCHELALGLLDEVWVSSEYGAGIYARPGGPPVTNVGMCFEEVAAPDREAARAFVERRFRLARGDFVFLVAFDSFSFVQRKNPVGAIHAFRQAFPDRADVRLVLKTQNRDNVHDPAQARIWAQIDAAAAADPRVLVVNETLTYQDLLGLKKGCDCYVSLHRSEGWGFGMIEAMNLRVPVVCTGYSGNMEFCGPDTAWLVEHSEATLAPGDYIFVRRGQRWAEPDPASAARQMRRVVEEPEERARKVEAAWRNVQENFSPQAIAKRYERRLRAILRGLGAEA